MEMRVLGRSGVRFSTLTLGAMAFGSMGNTDRDDCVRIIHRALDAGINVIDTADIYSAGESESIVGDALKGRRDDVVLATKSYNPMGRDPNRRGSSRRWIIQACEDSLRRLGTDHIDLYQLHRPDEDTDIEDTLLALTDLVRQGKVWMIGSSTFPAEAIVEAHWASERRGAERLRSEQPPYSVFVRGIERDVLPTCQRYGMGVIVWSPLDGGWLSGRYRTADDFTSDTRLVRMASRWGGFDPEAQANKRKLDLVNQLAPLAEETGVPLSHFATAWVLEHPDVTSAIIGPRTMERLEDSLAAADLRLSTEVLDAVDALLPPGSDVNPIDPSSAPAELAPRYRRRPR